MRLQTDRKLSFAEARNFVVYYGHGQANVMSKYDIAIVEPAGQTEESLKEMQEAGTLVFAYVSMTEVPKYDQLKTLLREVDYLKLNGEIVANEEYHTLVADLRSSNWIGLLLHRIGGHLRNSNYDGIFMDTISNVEWPSLPAGMRAEQQAAALELVKRIRKLHPNHLIIQNNGLEILCVETAPYIDGICWENPDFVRPETYSWHETVRLRLKQLAANNNTRILFLQEKSTTNKRGLESAVNWAKRENYLHYLSSNHYLEMDSI
ncbi:MAG: endo alpha-1,4 polygalactosaminidase [Paenibacillaceae bacterium]